MNQPQSLITETFRCATSDPFVHVPRLTADVRPFQRIGIPGEARFGQDGRTSPRVHPKGRLLPRRFDSSDAFPPQPDPTVQSATSDIAMRIGMGGANQIDKPMATEQHAIRRGILAYLSERPDSSDTVEGIVEWWLLHQRIQESVAETEKALDELVQRELVFREQGANGRARYRLNPRNLGKVRGLVHGRMPVPTTGS